MCRNVCGVMKTGVMAVCGDKWCVGEGKLARVNEEKGKYLGAKLDEIRVHVRAVALTKTCRPISARAKVRSTFLLSGSRAEPVRQQLPRETWKLPVPHRDQSPRAGRRRC
jgi:hypothetical protein